MSIPTPHINAKEGDFAKTVIMPGDPLRAKFIADNYLEDVCQVTDVRGMYGYTGKYKGKDVSVMGHGMGMPSAGIYTYELFAFYGVDNIIRVGSAGSIQTDLKVGDVVIAQGACTNSAWANQYELGGTFAPIASWELLYKAVQAAEANNTKYVVGNVISSDVFYGEGPDFVKRWSDMGVLCTEMECAAIYMNAAKLGKKALGLLTISDELLTGASMTSYERQTTFDQMMKLALEMI
ncbi:MAG: purine-nucleoside phosphorylase [Lachnospiraceae bacterium]|nr:purine-nucleoside phosphorylase [Candidatus Equihabitans merdae]